MIQIPNSVLALPGYRTVSPFSAPRDGLLALSVTFSNRTSAQTAATIWSKWLLGEVAGRRIQPITGMEVLFSGRKILSIVRIRFAADEMETLAERTHTQLERGLPLFRGVTIESANGNQATAQCAIDDADPKKWFRTELAIEMRATVPNDTTFDSLSEGMRQFCSSLAAS